MLKVLSLILWLAYQNNAYSLDALITADEVSNTISIVDSSTFKLLDMIALGPEREYALTSSVAPHIQNNVHGLALSPDKKTLAITSNISNSVVLYDMANLYKPLKYFNVGLSPHIAMFRPDGNEIWVASRGTSFVDIIDTKKMQLTKPLSVSLCPSFFAFLTKTPHVFVSSICTNNLEVYNYNTRKLVKTIKMNGSFSPLLSLTPDQKEVWIIRKDSEEVTRVDTAKLEIVETFRVGNYPQHIAFTMKDNSLVGAVTIGGENSVKLYKFISGSKAPATFASEVKVAGIPHGIVSSPDNSKIYTATEFGDELIAISLKEMKTESTVKIGNSPQSLIFAKNITYTKNPDKVLNNRSEVNSQTLNYLLSSNVPSIKGASLSMRSSPHNIHTTFGVFGTFSEKDEFKFYVSKSVKSLKDINTDDKTLIGYAFCRKNAVTCLNYSSMTQDFSIVDKMKDTKYKIFAVNKSENIFLISQ